MNKSIPARLKKDGQTVLGIPIGSGKKEFALTKMTALRAQTGWLVGDEEVKPWTVEGFFESEGRVFLYGPYYDGVFLDEVLKAGPDKALYRLLNLTRALQLLEQKGTPLEHLQTDSVFFLDSGEVLFLPQEIMKRTMQTRPLEYKLRVFEIISHPDLVEPKERISYSIAVMLFKVITGEFPFKADTEEEIHHRIRHFRLTPPGLLVPRLKPEISKALMRRLDAGSRKDSSPNETEGKLEDWRSGITHWIKEGLYREIQESEVQDLGEQALQSMTGAEKSFARRVYWEKHWKSIAISAVAAILVLAVGGSFIKRFLEPRATQGFSPYQVVETFYQSVNTMDHGLMEDCVTNKAGKSMINEVIHVFVLSRVSMGYEGKSHINRADEWADQGKPPLIPPQTVFGVANLTVREIAAQPQPVFEVVYEKWGPFASEEPSQSQEPPTEPNYRGVRLTERVFLREDKGDWVIYHIEPVRSEPLEIPKF